MDDMAERFFPSADTDADPAPLTTLVDFDPDAEIHMVTAMLYPHTHVPETQVEAKVRAMSALMRSVIQASMSCRRNRHSPPTLNAGRSPRWAIE